MPHKKRKSWKPAAVFCLLVLAAVPLMAQSRYEDLYTRIQGTRTLNNASPTDVVITSQTAHFLTIETIYVSCLVAAVGSGGRVKIRLGGDIIYQRNADAVFSENVEFGIGGLRAATAGTSLDMEVADAATTQATCLATAVGHILAR